MSGYQKLVFNISNSLQTFKAAVQDKKQTLVGYEKFRLNNACPMVTISSFCGFSQIFEKEEEIVIGLVLIIAKLVELCLDAGAGKKCHRFQKKIPKLFTIGPSTVQRTIFSAV